MSEAYLRSLADELAGDDRTEDRDKLRNAADLIASQDLEIGRLRAVGSAENERLRGEVRTVEANYAKLFAMWQGCQDAFREQWETIESSEKAARDAIIAELRKRLADANAALADTARHPLNETTVELTGRLAPVNQLIADLIDDLPDDERGGIIRRLVRLVQRLDSENCELRACRTAADLQRVREAHTARSGQPEMAPEPEPATPDAGEQEAGPVVYPSGLVSWAIDDDGHVLRSEDDGKTWRLWPPTGTRRPRYQRTDPDGPIWRPDEVSA